MHVLTDGHRKMPSDSSNWLVHALLDHLPHKSSPVVIVVKPDPLSPNPSKPNRHRSSSGAPIYDPSILYVLEMASMLATRDDTSIAAVGKDVAEALQNVVRDATNVHPLIVSRAIFYLLHLLHASHVSDSGFLILTYLIRIDTFIHPSSRNPTHDLQLDSIHLGEICDTRLERFSVVHAYSRST